MARITDNRKAQRQQAAQRQAGKPPLGPPPHATVAGAAGRAKTKRQMEAALNAPLGVPEVQPFALKTVAQACEAAGLDLAGELVRLLKDPGALGANMRARVLSGLLEYTQPKLRAVELSGPGGGPVETKLSDDQVTRIAAEVLKAHGQLDG